MARARQPVSIGGVEFDALIKVETTYQADVPQYPIETGFTISDSVIVKQTELDMTLFLTDTPVTWMGRHGYVGRSSQALSHLKNLFVSRQTVAVSTSEGNYTDMAIESYTVEKSTEIGYAYEIPVKLVQINRTQNRTTTIPDSYGKSGATGVATGPASTTTESQDVGTQQEEGSTMWHIDEGSGGKISDGGAKVVNGIGKVVRKK